MAGWAVVWPLAHESRTAAATAAEKRTANLQNGGGCRTASSRHIRQPADGAFPLTQPVPSDIPPVPVARSYYIHTFGCQMNESDSQRMGEALARAGWAPTEAPDGADLVLVNTCSIREKAEDKLFS